MKYAFAAAIFAITTNCYAADVYLTSGFVSHHISQKKYNETNSGIGLEVGFNENINFNVGRYHNSKYKMSNYGTISYLYPVVEANDVRVRIGAMTGAASGYKRDRTIPMFALVSSFDYTINNVKVGFNFLIIPEYKTSPTTFCIANKDWILNEDLN